MNSQKEESKECRFLLFLDFLKKIQKMIDNDFYHVYTENVNKGPVPQNKSSALILFF